LIIKLLFHLKPQANPTETIPIIT